MSYTPIKFFGLCLLLCIGLSADASTSENVPHSNLSNNNMCTVATYIVTVDLSNCPMIDIIVEVTDLGSATTLDITESTGTDSELDVGLGTYTLTGYSPGDGLIAVFITDHDDASCQDIAGANIPAGCPPSNDLCGSAVNVLAGSNTPGTTVASTQNDQPGFCGTGITSPGVWYTYTSNVEGEEITVGLCGASYDSKMNIYKGSCGTFICVAGSDDDCMDDPEITFTSTSGGAPPVPVQYFIYIHGFAGQTGTFEMSLASNAAPLTLLSFEGDVLEFENRLRWVTASEENTLVHVVERSIEGQEWDAIGAREASGFSQTEQNYEYTDQRPLAKAFYRLKTIDFDGTEYFSEVIILERRKSGLNITNVYPIPVDAELTVEFENDKNETVEIAVSDMMGRIVHQEFFAASDGANLFGLDMIDFSYGVYTLIIKTDKAQKTQRIVKNNPN